MQISDVLSDPQRNVNTIGQTEALSAAVHALAGTKVRSLVVVQDGAVVGMLTVRDILKSLDDRGGDALGAPVKEAMTTDVATVTSTTSLEDALKVLVARAINHLPVVDDGKLVGLVTPSDVLARYLDETKHLNDELVRFIHGSYAL